MDITGEDVQGRGDETEQDPAGLLGSKPFKQLLIREGRGCGDGGGEVRTQ